ncbi:MAG: MBL fold metallo-hydrolase [Gammaproteobacteria bacterium]|nr:MBL fold metallo-hydrolase [Gammaproteobacteria bacterium]MDH3430714.1 MBL fold metallo-hydrolase [Gammaproteobacteria bacterium]
MIEARIQHFYDEPSGTLSYVVADENSGHAAVIDPVVGFSMVSGRIDTGPSDVVIEYVHKEKLGLEWILETHAHADHLSGAQYIKSNLGGSVAIGEGIRDVQAHFGPVFNLGSPFAADGHQFDRLFADGDRIRIGELECQVIATPGHTNDSVSYKIGSAVFVGDSMFMPDFGTARCDFPGGDAGLLYDSIQRILSLPGDTRLFMCHDYMPGGRELRWECTVEEQRAANIHVGKNTDKVKFTKMRTERDAQLNLPALIVPAIQVNIRAGHLPDPEDNDITYIKTPVNTL